MVNLIKYNLSVAQIVLFLTFGLAVSCGPKPNHVTKVEGREIPVTAAAGEKQEFETFIKPYREHIDRDLSTVLAYSPKTLDKSNGQWETAIGNAMADASLDFGNRVFEKRAGKKIDIAMLNFGGIRSIIPQGEVTTRTAFEIMPFENSLVVAELPGSAILKMLTYFIAEKKPHPLSGISFAIAENQKPKNIIIAGKPFDESKNYFVATSDYLLNGGDNMVFFKDAVATHDLDYKIRNVLIDYFRETDTITPRSEPSIKFDKR